MKKPKKLTFIDKKEYAKYLKTPHWASVRNGMLNKFKQCQKCNATKNLQVYHKHYETLGAESFNDLELICGKCHFEEHRFDLLMNKSF